MKLLLDEMWSPTIAHQLRRRGHDVVAVGERSGLIGRSDADIFKAARAEGRALVTDNVRDFRRLAQQLLQRGQSHSGLIFTTDRQLSRHDERTLGRLVNALDGLLHSGMDLTNVEHWLS